MQITMFLYSRPLFCRRDSNDDVMPRRGRGILVFGIIYAIGGLLRHIRRPGPRGLSIEDRLRLTVARIKPVTETVLKALALREIGNTVDCFIRDILHYWQGGNQ